MLLATSDLWALGDRCTRPPGLAREARTPTLGLGGALVGARACARFPSPGHGALRRQRHRVDGRPAQDPRFPPKEDRRSRRTALAPPSISRARGAGRPSWVLVHGWPAAGRQLLQVRPGVVDDVLIVRWDPRAAAALLVPEQRQRGPARRVARAHAEQPHGLAERGGGGGAREPSRGRAEPQPAAHPRVGGEQRQRPALGAMLRARGGQRRAGGAEAGDAAAGAGPGARARARSTGCTACQLAVREHGREWRAAEHRLSGPHPAGGHAAPARPRGHHLGGRARTDPRQPSGGRRGASGRERGKREDRFL
ncbi:unnamed protein product [Prorocentrum cordatum]|uniref:Uncharacterized protein n=1 Tax=Prorocentrum cordatum TaxID=2364126 RepID=A0ABN9V906_9DINO|nr:unnamed protein product [Polarella glacialis]